MMKFKVFKEKVAEMDDASVVEIIEELCDESGEHDLYDHMEYAANMAVEISDHYTLNSEDAYLTGILHDIGRLIDKEEYLEILSEYAVAVTDQEKQVLDLLHAKVSEVIAREVFKIKSEAVSQGILSHSTLRKNPSDFEKIIFIADKLSWADEELVEQIEETVLQNLNVTCYKTLAWLIEHIEAEKGLLLDATKEAYDFFKARML